MTWSVGWIFINFHLMVHREIQIWFCPLFLQRYHRRRLLQFEFRHLWCVSKNASLFIFHVFRCCSCSATISSPQYWCVSSRNLKNLAHELIECGCMEIFISQLVECVCVMMSDKTFIEIWKPNQQSSLHRC